MNYAEQIPLPDDFLAEPPSPYRRRPKAVGVRRGAGIGVRLLKVGIFGVLLPLVLIAAAYHVVMCSAASAHFRFNPERDMTFEGNHFVSQQDLITALGFGSFVPGGERNLFSLNLTAESRRLERIPWVKSATVSRLFPNRLVVNVVERKPLAFASVSGRLMLVDKKGVFLERPEKAAFDFPVVHGLDVASNPAGRERLLEPYVAFMKQAGDALERSGWMISEAGLGDPNDLQLLLVQGSETILVHFGDQDFNQRFETFATFASRVLADNPRIGSMDLRYHDEVVVDPSTAATGQGPKAKTAQQLQAN
ncbi:MAG TPA: FtsQ-type POTRA domain-containing protein [Terriglobia bacterium]|nr:FtsQ-type POTRA domain-containing protein [Terriglobia bacterium]